MGHSGPVHSGVRSKAQVHHNDDEPGLVGTLPSNRRSLKDQAVTRSRPNKAVDVIVSQPREADCFGTNQNRFVFPSTPRPIRLSSFRNRAAHRLRRSTRADAARRQVFVPPPQKLVSWRSFLHARRVSFRIVVSLCPARTGPGCSARCPPAVCAASCRQPC